MNIGRNRDEHRFETLIEETQTSFNRLELSTSNLSGDELYKTALKYQELCQAFAYLSTFYPGTMLCNKARLLVAKGRRLLYGKRLNEAREENTFFQRVPLAFSELKSYVIFSLCLFVLSAALTALMVYFNPHFGWEFVNERIVADLRNGKLWTEQIRGFSSLSSARIGTNNIQVAFTAFGLGIAGCVFTILLLVNNAAMLGGVFAALAQYQQADLLFNFVIAHGVLELSIIVVAGAAGISLGDALISPGNLTRRAALARRARPAVELMLFSALCLIPAAIVEGYISPYAEIPEMFKVAIGITMGALYWMYLLRLGKSNN